MNMYHRKVKVEKIAGFLAESVGKGETVAKVKIQESIDSNNPEFDILLTNIYKLFISKTEFPINDINRFLIILHSNDEADIYINNFSEVQKVKINRAIKKGEKVYTKDIDKLVKVKFPDIDIKSDDAIIYCTRMGWKFGLYYDFSREIEQEKLYLELGNLAHDLMFKKIVSFTDSELLRNEKEEALIITEGKTDWKHLKRAKEKLDIKLPIGFNEIEEEMRGDIDLLKMCQHYSRTTHGGQKMIFVFDSDNPNIIKELKKKKSKKDYQEWGNDVYSLLLPKPAHRLKMGGISIEFLFTDNEIMSKDKRGRRLFLSTEFKEKTGRHIKLDEVSYKYSQKLKGYTTEKNKTVIDDKVYNKEEKSIALSKADFADNVINGVKGFDKFDFKNFKNIFSVIEKILKE